MGDHFPQIRLPPYPTIIVPALTSDACWPCTTQPRIRLRVFPSERARTLSFYRISISNRLAVLAFMETSCGARVRLRPSRSSPCYRVQESRSPPKAYAPPARSLVLTIGRIPVWPVLFRRTIGPQSESAHRYIDLHRFLTRSSAGKSNSRILLYSFIG